MNVESDFYEFKIKKPSRRNTQETEKNREGHHPFKLYPHAPKRKDRQRRAHELERKAARR